MVPNYEIIVYMQDFVLKINFYFDIYDLCGQRVGSKILTIFINVETIF